MPAFASEIVNRITVEPGASIWSRFCGGGWKS